MCIMQQTISLEEDVIGEVENLYYWHSFLKLINRNLHFHDIKLTLSRKNVLVILLHLTETVLKNMIL